MWSCEMTADQSPGDFCATGVGWQEQLLTISPTVTLHLITFSPPVPPAGPPVLFVPGWISRLDSWGDALREWTATHTIYYLETREKTVSPIDPAEPITVETIADDILQVIEILGLKDQQFILFGSSLGATAIIEACRHFQARPKLIALVGPNAEFQIPGWGVVLVKIFRPGWYFAIKPWLKWYLRTFRLDVEADQFQYYKYCGNLDAADPRKLKIAALAFRNYTVWDLLPTIPIPIIMFGGSDDHLHDHENILKMDAGLPHSKYVDMGTNYNTHSGEMIKYLLEFENELEKRG